MSDSLQPHGLTEEQQAPLSFAISQSLLKFMYTESVMLSNHLIPFSSGTQSFPASGSFLESQFFASGAKSIGVSASASVHNISVNYFHSLINNNNNNDNLYVISNQMTISNKFFKHFPPFFPFNLSFCSLPLYLSFFSFFLKALLLYES